MTTGKVKQGCLSRTRVVLVGAGLFIAGLAAFAANRDAFISLVTGFFGLMVTIAAGIFNWFTEPIFTTRAVFAGLLTIMALSVGYWLLRKLEKHEEPKQAVFRELYFILEDQNGLPKVINNELETALCGRCKSHIVGTYSDPPIAPIQYLVCDQGHRIGAETKYEDFIKQRDESLEQARREIAERKSQGRSLPMPYQTPSTTADLRPPMNAVEFYRRAVYDFEQPFIAEALSNLKTWKSRL